MLHVGFHRILGWLDHLQPAHQHHVFLRPLPCGWLIGLDAVMGWTFCRLLSENFLVFKLCFSLCLSLFFSILFPCPLKNQLKHHVLCCSMFLYFSLGTWWWVANSALFCFMFLYFSWHLGRHMYFLASILLQLLKCSGLARTLYPVSSWEGDSAWCFHMWQCLKTCEKLWNKWTAFDSTCTGQDLIELDTW